MWIWVVAISVPILLFLPEIAAPNRSYAISFAAIAGGFLFGIGAATNGGCAFSTLGHLANGNLWMLTTLFGFCFGVAGLSILFPNAESSQALMPLLSKAPKPLIINLFLFLALFGGMLLSAHQRGSFRLRWHRIKTWPRHFIGGFFMGAGAVLIPGGNETLILKSLPGLSPHAMPATAALLCEIGITLLLMRLFTGKTFKVVCTDDICRTED